MVQDVLFLYDLTKHATYREISVQKIPQSILQEIQSIAGRSDFANKGRIHTSTTKLILECRNIL